MKQHIVLLLSVLVGVVATHAQLVVDVSPVKITGQKAVVPLALKNNLRETVESARAVCFLSDEQGKAVGHATHWVIGGTKDRPALSAGATNAFSFVITSEKLFATTNLTAKVSFTRIVLEGGKVADVTKDVVVTAGGK